MPYPADDLYPGDELYPGDCIYCSAADVKARFGTQWMAGTDYDALLTELTESASRQIDDELYWGFCHFAAQDLRPGITRYFDTEGGMEMWIPRCTKITTLRLDYDGDGVYETTWVENTDFIVWPYAKGSPWGDSFDKIIVKESAGVSLPTGQQRMEIKGEWGGAARPPQIIKEACAITAARWFKRGMQAYQDTGALPEMGELVYTKALDPDVQEILKKMARRVGVG